MGYIEDLRGKKQGQGRPRWRARYRDPSGRERSKSFARKVDAEQFRRWCRQHPLAWDEYVLPAQDGRAAIEELRAMARRSMM